MQKIPKPQWQVLNIKQGMSQYYREEVTLNDSNDVLFSVKNT